MKKMWRFNGEIPNCDFILPYESNDYTFVYGEKKFLGRNFLSGHIFISEKMLLRFYMDKNELRKSIKAILSKILNDPDFVDNNHAETIRLNNEYFRLAEDIRKMQLNKLTNKQLINLRDKLYILQGKTHGNSIATTWLVDSDGEDFSKFLIDLIHKKIEQQQLDLTASEIFPILSTPIKESMAIKEEKDFFELLKAVLKNRRVKRLFQSQTTAQLVENFKKFPSVIKKKFINHHYKWQWVPYGYIGPAYSLDYYLEMVRGLIHEGFDPEKEIKKLKNKAEKIKHERKLLEKKLGLSAYEKHLFNIAADIVWIKGFRKDCYFHGFFVMDMVLSEVAKRTGLSLMQAKYLTNPEINDALLKGKDYANLANERMKISFIMRDGKKTILKSGNEAREFLRREKFEKVKLPDPKEITGTCACVGSAIGKVKVINLPEEMGKMKDGDIMISHTTYPALVPAMKKAAAIVTEDGGITCHAAIVARELQTPCVVGCRNISQVLKDGDKVEVDANKGVIRKI